MMNTMIVQGKPEMMAHIPHHHHHQLKAAGMTTAGPGAAMQHPGLTHAGLVGLNGENHVKRPMNAFMVSLILHHFPWGNNNMIFFFICSRISFTVLRFVQRG